MSSKENIEQIKKDIEAYRQAIENAEGALAAAERELQAACEEAEPDREDISVFVPVKNLAKEEIGKEIELKIVVLVNDQPVSTQKITLLDDDALPF